MLCSLAYWLRFGTFNSVWSTIENKHKITRKILISKTQSHDIDDQKKGTLFDEPTKFKNWTKQNSSFFQMTESEIRTLFIIYWRARNGNLTIIFHFVCNHGFYNGKLFNVHTKTNFFWFCAFVTVASRTTNTNALLLHSVATDWDHSTNKTKHGALRLWNCFLCGFNAPCYRTHAHYYLLHFSLLHF